MPCCLPAVELAAQAIGYPLVQIVGCDEAIRIEDCIRAFTYERPLTGVLRERVADVA